MYSIAIRRARKPASKIAGCDIANDVISLHWQGPTANISFHSQSFFAAADESHGRGTYVDPLLAIDRFRSDLTERQSKGCLSEKENERIRRAIVENLPLPPAIAYYLQLGSFDVSGYFDLTPDFRMQVASPIYSLNATPSPSTLVGYETANYGFLPDGGNGRTRLVLTSATETRIGSAPIDKQTLRNELPFPKSPGYFRLFFMTYETSSGRTTRAILVSALDEAKLTQAMAYRQLSPDEFCAALSKADVTCTVFPNNFGVSPELHVRVNGKDAFVPVGGMLQEIRGLEHPENGPPRSLKLLRPFHGRLIPIKFERSNGDILKLVLLPGDQISF